MTANTNPIYSRVADVQWGGAPVLAANTTRDLTSGTSYLVFTSDATEGGYLNYLLAQPLGTNVQSVLRVWMNNGATTGTAANNTLLYEFTLPATTVSETAGIFPVSIPVEAALPPAYRVYVTIGTAIAAGVHVTAFGGKY